MEILGSLLTKLVPLQMSDTTKIAEYGSISHLYKFQVDFMYSILFFMRNVPLRRIIVESNLVPSDAIPIRGIFP